MGEVDWSALFQNLERSTRTSAGGDQHDGERHQQPHQPRAGAGLAEWEHEAAATLQQPQPQLQSAPPSPTHHVIGNRPLVRRGNTLPSPKANHSFSLPHTPQIPPWPAYEDHDGVSSHARHDSAFPPSVIPPPETSNRTWGSAPNENVDFGGMNPASLAEYIHLLSNHNHSAPPAETNQGWTGVQARTASGSGQSTPLGPPGVPLQIPPLANPQRWGGAPLTGGGSNSTGPSPTSADPQATPGEVADTEDKRVRNTMASAKFRAKKKQHMETVQRSITELQDQKVELERDVKGLKQENGLLREMVQLKYGFDMKDKPGASGESGQGDEDQGGPSSGGRQVRRKSGRDEG